MVREWLHGAIKSRLRSMFDGRSFRCWNESKKVLETQFEDYISRGPERVWPENAEPQTSRLANQELFHRLYDAASGEVANPMLKSMMGRSC